MVQWATPKRRKKKKRTRDMADQEFQHLSDDKSRLFVVAMMSRPGAGIFVVDLEYNHFPPGSPKNEEFQMVISKWQGMSWMTIHVPIEYRGLVEEVAARNEMRLGDGIPTILGGTNGPQQFPVRGDNVFTLENAPNSPIYKGGEREVLKEQQRKIAEIIGNFERTHIDPIDGSGSISEESEPE